MSASPGLNLTVGMFSHPPFVDFVQERAEGVFWHLVEPALVSCLGNGVTLNLVRFPNEDALLRGGLNQCNLSFPVTKGPLHSMLSGSVFIPVIQTPGAVWLNPTAGPHQSDVSQLKVIAQAWPLLLIIMVSCSFAAVLVWLMERLKNPQEFPRPFLRGFWEGWWWAFITMTTVGYGDRSPKTIIGRLFAMMWISFGLVLISMFTAVVTTALSQGAQGPEEDNRFFQANITVINGSYEQVLVYELGSTPIRIADWRVLLKSSETSESASTNQALIGTSNDTVADEDAPHHGALIEHFMYLHMRREHPVEMRSLKPQFIMKRPSVRGVYSNLPSDINACLVADLLRQQIGVYSKILSHQDSEDQILDDPPVAEGVAQSLFSTSNKYLGIVAAVFCVIFVALLVWEKAYWMPRNPEYKFVELNWKYERQKKEAELTHQQDFKSYYRRHSQRGAAEPQPSGQSPMQQQQQQMQPEQPPSHNFGTAIQLKNTGIKEDDSSESGAARLIPGLGSAAMTDSPVNNMHCIELPNSTDDAGSTSL